MENSNIKIQSYASEEQRLDREFFMTNGVDLAKKLLGKIIVRNINGQLVKVKIVETEAYIGPDDKGAHCYNNRKTERTKYFWQPGGFLYVYRIHQSICLNIVSNSEDKPEAILIRAGEALSGLDTIKKLRGEKKSLLKKNDIINLTNGPGKVGASLNLKLSDNAVDICTSDEFYLLDNPEEEIVWDRSTRININYAKEYRFKPWRFFIKDNPFVSKGKVEHQYIDD
jgi:DNA-3-methyladenine glycosylase